MWVGVTTEGWKEKRKKEKSRERCRKILWQWAVRAVKQLQKGDVLLKTPKIRLHKTPQKCASSCLEGTPRWGHQVPAPVRSHQSSCRLFYLPLPHKTTFPATRLWAWGCGWVRGRRAGVYQGWQWKTKKGWGQYRCWHPFAGLQDNTCVHQQRCIYGKTGKLSKDKGFTVWVLKKPSNEDRSWHKMSKNIIKTESQWSNTSSSWRWKRRRSRTDRREQAESTAELQFFPSPSEAALQDLPFPWVHVATLLPFSIFPDARDRNKYSRICIHNHCF